MPPKGQRQKIHLKLYALAGVAQWIEYWPANQRVAGLIPRAQAWLRGKPPVGGAREATTQGCYFPSLSSRL